MAAHHTKDKGDLGTAKAHADRVGLGLMVLFPATEHGEFDSVAYRDHTFHRVQVNSSRRTSSRSRRRTPPSTRTRHATRPAASTGRAPHRVRMWTGPATYEVAGPHLFPGAGLRRRSQAPVAYASISALIRALTSSGA